MNEWRCSKDGTVYVGDPSLGERRDVADVFLYRDLIVAAPDLLYACKSMLLILRDVIKKAEGNKMSERLDGEQPFDWRDLIDWRDLVLELYQENERLSLVVERAWEILHLIPELNTDDDRPWMRDVPDYMTLHRVNESISKAYRVLSKAKSERCELKFVQESMDLDENLRNARVKPTAPKCRLIRLNIGWDRLRSSGEMEKYLKPVMFRGEELGRITTLERDNGSRGYTETLYRAEDGRLIIYSSNWSRWQDEFSYYSIEQVQEDDLRLGGEFEKLGFECGFANFLSLDDALNSDEDSEV